MLKALAHKHEYTYLNFVSGHASKLYMYIIQYLISVFSFEHIYGTGMLVIKDEKTLGSYDNNTGSISVKVGSG